MNKQTAASLYDELVPRRRPFLERAREAAALTMPALMPPEGHNYTQALPAPYQSLGLFGLRNLGSKLLMIVLPATGSFFRLDLEGDARQQVEAQGELPEAQAALAKVERRMAASLEAAGVRPRMLTALLQLLCSGNVLMRMERAGGLRTYRLDRYVCRRYPSGRIRDVVLKEPTMPGNLPDAALEAAGIAKDKRDTNEPFDLYTHIYWDTTTNKYVEYQELEKVELPDTRSTYPADRMPWLLPRIMFETGEDYGRGYIDEVLGDLNSYEGFAKHLLEGAAAMAKVLIMRNPNGVARAKDVEKPNLSVINGMEGDLTAFRLDKGADFSVAFQQSEVIRQRLEQAFLMHSSIQRDAERVTAEEIRIMAQEVEDSLGGVYTLLSDELQLPMVRFYMRAMSDIGVIPELPTGVVEPTITTGLQALSRGHDLNKVRGFVQDIANLFGPEFLQVALKPEVVHQLGAGHGVNTLDLVRSPEEIQQAQQQQQLMQIAQSAGPDVINQLMGSMLPAPPRPKEG